MGFFQKLFQPKNQPQNSSNFWIKDSFPENQHLVPNINLTHPSNLPTFMEIAQNGHSDLRALLYSIKFKTADKPFTVDSFSDYEVADFGSSATLIDALQSRNLISELPTVEVLQKLYTVSELKSCLQKRGLKVGGNKEELASRLFADGFKGYTRRYKQKMYCLTGIGSDLLLEERSDREHSISSAISRLCVLDYFGAVSAYNSYDLKWGYVHTSGKNHTIFSDYDFPHSRFDFLATYPMRELTNSDEFKGKLRACLIAGLMRGEQHRDALANNFLRICSEPIRCPGIVDMYRREPTGWEDAESLNYAFDQMQKHAESDPRNVLEYYISKVLYLSRQ